MNKKPTFFIVGAPKCGTTAMDEYLAQSPDIFMARKEMHFFGGDLQFGSHFYRRTSEAYLAEFADWGQQSQAGESSVWYLFSKTAAAEIKAFNPDARIIIMLREPVEMIHSLYYSFRWDGNENLATFEEALAAEADRRQGLRLDRQTYLAQGLIYHDVGCYAEQIKRYYDVFGRDRVHVVIHDDLQANTREVYRKILEFLQVDSTNIRADFKTVNGNKFSKFSGLHSMMTDPMVRSAALAIRPWVPRQVFSAMQKVDAGIRKFNSRSGKRPQLATELRGQLKRHFSPEVERLSLLLGRDLTHWSKEVTRRPATVRLPALAENTGQASQSRS